MTYPVTPGVAEKFPSETPVVGKFKIKEKRDANLFHRHPLNHEFPGIQNLMPKTRQLCRQQPIFQRPKRETTECLTLPTGEVLKVDLDRGVKWSKAKEKWCAKTMFEGKKWTLGYFTDKKDANQAYMDAIKSKQQGCVKDHLEKVGARITVGSRGPSKKPKREYEFYAESPVLAKELSFKPSTQRPAYSLGGVTHKKRRGRPKKSLTRPNDLWRPIRPIPGRRSWSPYHGSSRSRSPHSPVKQEPSWGNAVKWETSWHDFAPGIKQEQWDPPRTPPSRTSSHGPDETSINKNAEEMPLLEVASILVKMKRSG